MYDHIGIIPSTCNSICLPTFAFSTYSFNDNISQIISIVTQIRYLHPPTPLGILPHWKGIAPRFKARASNLEIQTNDHTTNSPSVRIDQAPYPPAPNSKSESDHSNYKNLHDATLQTPGPTSSIHHKGTLATKQDKFRG